MPGAITHLCQACGGDLRLVRAGRGHLALWRCDGCRRWWEYGNGGWTDRTEEVSSGTRSTRRGSR